MLLLLSLFLNLKMAQAAAVPEMTVIPAGLYTPFFKETKEQDSQVLSFRMDKYPVSVADFNLFLDSHPQFRKSKVTQLYVDQRYLADWKTDLLTDEEKLLSGAKPITGVSWFVARKYCQAQGKRLPLIAEWEYASDSTNPEILKDLLDWYAKTGDRPIERIGKKAPNKFGLYDMHGLIWEWVEDFSSVMISSDSRSKGDRTDGSFCGGGSVSSLDSKSYATFMRYGFRSGLKGDYCMQNLGFRCAADIQNKEKK